MRKMNKIIVITICALLLITMIYHRVKPLPEGISYASDIVELSEDEVEFLADVTYQKDGKEIVDHTIFNEITQAIQSAEHFIILDLFLVNSYSNGERDYPTISSDLSKALLKQLENHPDLKVIFITDHINTTYGSHIAEEIAPLEKMGAEIVYTDLNQLRDPNILYSGLWRTLFQWFGQEGTGWLPNPMANSAPNVTLRSYLKLLNIKANHRKVVITEDAGYILSANPHDASGFHSNIGFKVKGEILFDMIQAERAVAAFSNGDLSHFPTEEELERWIQKSSLPKGDNKKLLAQILTEGKVRDALVEALVSSEKGDTIWIGMFYLADRDILQGIHTAAQNEASIKIILDPNQNAFGQQKMGLPNLPIASELMELNDSHIDIRWYNTNKEQYHTKLFYKQSKDQHTIIGGSSNFTSRNLDDYNLEEDIKIVTSPSSMLSAEVEHYFSMLWNNEGGEFTTEYDTYQDSLPVFKYILYWLQKVFQVTTY
ncbi:hypothetical protein Q75_09105 [Bacillus coahuilensis p1.1.43]|uniref:Phospholipase D-like domain-containing protein n=1 Tax=Bacillus coahuilensis p1.1.43 TaxID=1150625 RepID=A0A147K896_9BACI|nr:phospholipase D family protein [Bacillus coahuilensis]KUP06287.1 hypothetical protein Q75_09105 [Bacillus coahuilensis p1.1.43]